MIKHLLYYTPDRFQWWINHVGEVVQFVYAADTGSKNEGLIESQRVLTVKRRQDVGNYFEVVCSKS